MKMVTEKIQALAYAQIADAARLAQRRSLKVASETYDGPNQTLVSTPIIASEGRSKIPGEVSKNGRLGRRVCPRDVNSPALPCAIEDPQA
jgi:hypothetical protein